MDPAKRRAVSSALAATIAALFATATAQEGAGVGMELGSTAAFSFLEDEGMESWDFSFSGVTGLDLVLRGSTKGARAFAMLRTDILTGAAAAALHARYVSIDATAPGRYGSLMLFAAPDPADPSGAPSWAAAFDLRQLYVKLQTGPFSLTAGRQIVNYGRALVFSPVDFFTTATLSGLSAERTGTDALRLRLGLGDLSDAELVAEPRDAPLESRVALRSNVFLGGPEAGLAVLWDGTGESWKFGIDFKADIVVGLYGEAVLEWSPGGFPDGGTARFLGTAGLDWSLGPGTGFALEYHENGAGTDADGPLVPASAWPGKRYFFAMANGKIGDFLAVGGNAIWDVMDGIIQGTGSLSWDMAQGASLAWFLRASNGSTATRAHALAVSVGITAKAAF